MAKSSINIQPVKSGSESHNLRKKELKYVRKDLTHQNLNVGFEKTILEHKKEIENLYKEKVGQKMQKKTVPIREAVFLFEERHTNEDLLKVGKAIKERFKIKPIQTSIHRDEGHFEKHTKQWIPNLHAHIVFDFQDKETGKTIKLNRSDLSEMQDLVANILNMERGQKSSKKHLSSLAYKAKQREKELQKEKKKLEEQKRIFEKNKSYLEKLNKDVLKVKSVLDKDINALAYQSALKRVYSKHPEVKKAVESEIKAFQKRMRENNKKGPKL